MIEDILNFISMGGHGFYIWISYFIPLTLIFSFVLMRGKKLKKILEQIQEHD